MYDNLQVGDRVRVTMRWPESYIHATEPFRYNTYEGTVVKSNSQLDPPGTFNLLTGNPEYPVSIITLKHVINIEYMGSGIKIPVRANRTRYIVVQTTKGTEHRVGIHSTGHLSCDCMGYQYRKQCRHMTYAQSFLDRKYPGGWVKGVFK